MKIAAISTNEGYLNRLCRFLSGNEISSQCDAVLLQMKNGSMKDAVGLLRNKKKLSGYDLFVLSDLDRDQEIAAGLSVILQTGCLTMCADIAVVDGSLKVKREVFGGLAHLNLSVKKMPYVVTLSSAALDSENQDLPFQGERFDVSAENSQLKVLSTKEIKKTVDLSSAKKIVSVGRGIGKQENIEIIEKLAESMGAELGCSRPLSEDYKWLPLERQVGLTGETVKPELYFATGISGQVQHLVGMRDSRVVVAINNNKSAPIFQYCDYGIIGDLFEIVPIISQMISEKN